MITFSQAEDIHNILIEKFGGSKGVRDSGALSSALARPFQTFDGNELYPSVIEKAACLIESILLNHPFIDGNKRTGYVLMRLLLTQNELDIEATQDDKYVFVIGIASGNLRFNEIVEWLSTKTISPNAS
jgi:death-on-curing protein